MKNASPLRQTVTAALAFAVLSLVFAFARGSGFDSESAREMLLSQETRTYVNPVIPQNVPDPEIAYEAPYYYVFGTNTLAHEGEGWTDHKNHWMPIFRSKDMVHWSYLGDVFPRKPEWTGRDGLWAPDVHYWKGKYWLYYALSSVRIGLATAPHLEGPWTDVGHQVFENYIDPHVFKEGRHRYFVMGSYYNRNWPIVVQELSEDGQSLIGKKAEIGNGEGSFLQKRGKFYYFYQSFGNCCIDDSPYHVTVSRSKSLFGPYLDRNGSPTRVGDTILSGNSVWKGPGHVSILKDRKGRDWIFYHAIKDGKMRNGRWLLTDPIRWSKDGWPSVGTDGTPTLTSQPAPATSR
jgi:arabinan endo-1,5-alpha-L-arabinosidase